MKKRKSPDRERNWDNVFSGLMKLCRNLKEEREVLEERINYLRDLIDKMKMEQRYKSLQSQLFLGLKETEAITLKDMCEKAYDEIMDFREGFGYLCDKCSISSDETISRGECRNNILQDEVNRLKNELEKLRAEKKSEIFSLLSEKNFIWNQYKKLECDHKEQMSKKQSEIEKANDKVGLLLNRIEELHDSNETFKTHIANLESETAQKCQEISRLLKEIETLKSKSVSPTPLLRRCLSESMQHRMGGSSTTNDGKSVTIKRESDMHAIHKATRTKQTARKSTGGKTSKKRLSFKISTSSSTRTSRSKGKAVEAINIADDTPKLFSSAFKVPKLKPSMSPRIL